MAVAGIPELVNDFNLYVSGKKLLGHTGEVTLPSLEAKTQTNSGAGILGEYEAVAVGQYTSIEQEITFRCINSQLFSLCAPASNVDLTLRGSIQSVDAATGRVGHSGVRIVFRGRCKKLDTGKIKQAEGMDCTITLEVLYYLVEINGEKKLELDKLNGIFSVGGKDMLAAVRKLI